MFYFAHLIVIRPRGYRELHGRHKSRQLQPSDVQLSVRQTDCLVYFTYNISQLSDCSVKLN